jgi:hypothetical protein
MALSSVCGVPFLFKEQMVNSSNYLVMLQLFAVSHIAHLQPNVFFQQGGASWHWSQQCENFWTNFFQDDGLGGKVQFLWPLQFSSITPMDFFL